MAQRRGGDHYSEFDWASEHVADPAPTPDVAAMEAEEAEQAEERTSSGHQPDAAAMVSASFRLIAERTGGNPFLLLAVMGRVGGMTLKEIGRLSGCTKQAVDKHLREIAKRDPAMANVLRQRWHYQAAIDPSACMLAKMGVIDAVRPSSHRRRATLAAQHPYLPGLGG